MENQQEPVVVNVPSNGSGVGGKIAIAIIVLVLLIGALYYFSNRNNQVSNVNESRQTADDTDSLNKELDTAASADIEADLKQMDQEFSQ